MLTLFLALSLTYPSVAPRAHLVQPPAEPPPSFLSRNGLTSQDEPGAIWHDAALPNLWHGLLTDASSTVS